MTRIDLFACRTPAALPNLTAKAAAMLLFLGLVCACVPPGSTPVTTVSTPAPASQVLTPLASLTAPPLAATTAVKTTAPEVGICRLEELSGSMDWQRSAGALVGQLQLANFGAQSCAVQGAPQIELFNENGWKLPVDQVQANPAETPARVVLDPAGTNTTEARFTWRNWCTPATRENLHLEIVLADNPGKLNVPVQDPNGQYLTDTPRCDDRSSPSTLTVEDFK